MTGLLPKSWPPERCESGVEDGGGLILRRDKQGGVYVDAPIQPLGVDQATPAPARVRVTVPMKEHYVEASPDPVQDRAWVIGAGEGDADLPIETVRDQDDQVADAVDIE